eukprot:9008546-Alexandrium_andersonii.AAC.1
MGCGSRRCWMRPWAAVVGGGGILEGGVERRLKCGGGRRRGCDGDALVPDSEVHPKCWSCSCMRCKVA